MVSWKDHWAVLQVDIAETVGIIWKFIMVQIIWRFTGKYNNNPQCLAEFTDCILMSWQRYILSQFDEVGANSKNMGEGLVPIYFPHNVDAQSQTAEHHFLFMIITDSHRQIVCDNTTVSPEA